MARVMEDKTKIPAKPLTGAVSVDEWLIASKKRRPKRKQRRKTKK